jgi:hypothetical protein
MKERRKYQRTSAAAISTYLRRKGIDVESVRMALLRERWVVVVNCRTMMQATAVWNGLRANGYNMVGQFQTWVIVAEMQTDVEGVL